MQIWILSVDSGSLAALAPRNDSRSGVEAKMHHVAVGDDILLAFQPELAGVAGAGLAAVFDEVIVGDGLGADEAALEVAVDHARRRRPLGALGDGPGPRLFRPGGEIRDEVQKLVAGTDQAVEPGFLQ